MAQKTLLMVKVDPPAGREAEFNKWYDTQHVPDRMAIPGFLSARRFTKIEGLPKDYAIGGEAKYLALYDLASAKVLTSEPYLKLREREKARPPGSVESLFPQLPKYVRAVYEELDLGRGEYRVPSAGFAFIVGHDAPPNHHQEFDAWYNTEHLPALMACPGFLTGRRFKLVRQGVPPITGAGGTLSQYFTVYDLESEQALQTPAFLNAARSPWSDWVRSWYTRRICCLYRRIPKGT